MKEYDYLAGLMKALAHPVRLQILEILKMEGEACVCHLQSRLDQRQAYMSQQLGSLRDAGLVVDRREGLNVYYTFATEAIATLLDDAKRVASAVSGIEGIELEFRPIPEAKPEDCGCPTCQQAILPTEMR